MYVYRLKEIFHVTHAKLRVLFLPGVGPQDSGIAQNFGIDSGKVAGTVMGTLALVALVAIAVVVTLGVISRKMYKKNQLKRMQLDILAL